MENPEASTELSKERQIMRAMRKTLTSIVRDTAPRDGNASPLCTDTVENIRMCLGLTLPDSGQISAFGLAMPQQALAIKNQLGVVSQFDTLDPDFSCLENLLVYGRYFGVSRREMLARADGEPVWPCQSARESLGEQREPVWARRG